MTITPYLSFEGRCEEAINFYKQTLGAEVEMLMRFKDSPEQPSAEVCAGGEAKFGPNNVMHAALRIGTSTLFCTDGETKGKPNFEGIALSLALPNPAATQKAFDALAQGGKVMMPLTKTFFAAAFGMVVDPIGVTWMLIAENA